MPGFVSIRSSLFGIFRPRAAPQPISPGISVTPNYSNVTIEPVVVTTSGADEMMTLRIAITRLLSLAIVIVLFDRSKAREKATFREAIGNRVVRSEVHESCPNFSVK